MVIRHDLIKRAFSVCIERRIDARCRECLLPDLILEMILPAVELTTVLNGIFQNVRKSSVTAREYAFEEDKRLPVV